VFASEPKFWSEVATKYDGTVDAQLGKNLREMIRERLSHEQGLGETVEIGCGSGMFTGTLAGRASHVVATDIAEGMLAVAKEALRGNENVTFQIEDCQKTSFGPAVFDSAFLALVLQFVDADAAIRELHRILKPNGTLLIANLDVQALTVPMRLLLIARTLCYSKVKYNRPMPRVSRKRMLSSSELRTRLESSGFRVECLEQIRDRSCAYNCPVAYVKAIRQ